MSSQKKENAMDLIKREDRDGDGWGTFFTFRDESIPEYEIIVKNHNSTACAWIVRKDGKGDERTSLPLMRLKSMPTMGAVIQSAEKYLDFIQTYGG
jgi:hypothetical protein